MLVQTGLFTSESVSDGHPDKICDQISDAILDACLGKTPESRGDRDGDQGADALPARRDHHGMRTSILAPSRRACFPISAIPMGAGASISTGLAIVEDVTLQSAEIKAGVDGKETGAGDQGTMFGFACDETPELMPLPIILAHALMRKHRAVRHSSDGVLLGPDAKAQVTVRYHLGVPIGLDTIVLSTQHSPELTLINLRDLVRSSILEPVLGDLLTE